MSGECLKGICIVVKNIMINKNVVLPHFFNLTKKWIVSLICANQQLVVAAEMMIQRVDRLPRLSIKYGDPIGHLKITAPHVHGIKRAEISSDSIRQIRIGLASLHTC